MEKKRQMKNKDMKRKGKEEKGKKEKGREMGNEGKKKGKGKRK